MHLEYSTNRANSLETEVVTLFKHLIKTIIRVHNYGWDYFYVPTTSLYHMKLVNIASKDVSLGAKYTWEKFVTCNNDDDGIFDIL